VHERLNELRCGVPADFSASPDVCYVEINSELILLAQYWFDFILYARRRR